MTGMRLTHKFLRCQLKSYYCHDALHVTLKMIFTKKQWFGNGITYSHVYGGSLDISYANFR